MKITSERLYIDLLVAYMHARQHKGCKKYIADFEANLEDNLRSLRDELLNRQYKAQPSTCFIVFHPKQREIFAANFRDRIVHHLIFDYVHEMLERTFIHDSYSCIKHRGTHFGIDRMARYLRKCSHDNTQEAYIMKMDISGYFMHIDRSLLYHIAEESIRRMAEHRTSNGTLWKDVIDTDFVLYLVREVIMLDPTTDCIVKGSRHDWDGLPASKSLFKTAEGCGLPIGNLTSQLFSNVYLNGFDQYMKRELKCRYYGRYVDDFYVISTDKAWLHSLIPQVESYLRQHLHLNVNRGKTKIYTYRRGVDFLGGYIKPYRIYISNQSLRRMQKQMAYLYRKDEQDVFASINSYLGVLSHYKTYAIRKQLAHRLSPLYMRYASVDERQAKLIAHPWVMINKKKLIFQKPKAVGRVIILCNCNKD